MHVEALGRSESFLRLQEQISAVAPIERPVLILGERGSGKELAAGRLHFLSQRWQAPLVVVNCAALLPNLIESELFGHEAGAFTDAHTLHRGKFERAHQGTLFLDEIGCMPMQVQEKILRVIEYGSFERVGGSEQIQVDVRIIAATNADLGGLVRGGTFKADLLDRLSFEVIRVPPLRSRSEDILLLADHFARAMAVELKMATVPHFSPSVQQQLLAYSWPGNIRECKNVIERSVYKARGAEITEIECSLFTSDNTAKAPSGQQPPSTVPSLPLQSTPALTRNKNHLVIPLTMSIPQARITCEVEIMRHSLQQTHYNLKAAAQRCHLAYHQFRRLYQRHRAELTPGDTSHETA